MKPGAWTDIEALAPADLVNRLLVNIDALGVGDNDPEDEDRAIAALPEPLRLLYVLNWMDYEITQGGLTTYLFNSHGRQARLAADALRLIGADSMATAISRAADIADAHAVAWNDRHDELDQLPEFTVTTPYQDLEGTTALDDLADDYWAAEADDDWPTKLETYLAGEAAAVRAWAEG